MNLRRLACKLDDSTVKQLTLKDYGWGAHFQAQLTDDDAAFLAVRVLAVHRDALDVAGPGYEGRVLPSAPSEDDEEQATVGDWLLFDVESRRPARLLERRSVFKRKSAGSGRRVQLIASNVDTLLLVTSANQDFNVARLERYLALAAEAEVAPVVVITKADLSNDVEPFLTAARRLMRGLVVEAFDAREPLSLKCLEPWFGRGQTLALLGSSGVGKSTIVNSMRGEALLHTQGIREDDARGRHTTTGRSLHRLECGAWLMDTPGMRELQIVDAAEGLAEVFSDVAGLAAACRFSDCGHEGEPGCAVQAALDAGTLDAGRVKRFGKLQREERRNSESVAVAHERNRKFGRMAKRVFAHKLRNREW